MPLTRRPALSSPASRHVVRVYSRLLRRTSRRIRECVDMCLVPAGGRIPLIGQVPPSGTHWRSGKLPRGWARGEMLERAEKWLNMKLQGCYIRTIARSDRGTTQEVIAMEWIYLKATPCASLPRYVLNIAGRLRIPRSFLRQQETLARSRPGRHGVVFQRRERRERGWKKETGVVLRPRRK